jgi:hypothetical protein
VPAGGNFYRGALAAGGRRNPPRRLAWYISLYRGATWYISLLPIKLMAKRNQRATQIFRLLLPSPPPWRLPRIKNDAVSNGQHLQEPESNKCKKTAPRLQKSDLKQAYLSGHYRIIKAENERLSH